MAEKDILEKTLESYNDVFADIVNVLIFDGEQVVKEDDLEDATPFSMYKIDEKIHEQERDCAKYWNTKNQSDNGKQKIRIALVGFENQTIPDKQMPIRVIGYDGASYRAQINDNQNEFYPVITLVLYFGYKHWSEPKRLSQCFEIDSRIKKFVNDYKVNVIEVSFLTKKQISMFKSDFKIIADYFVQSRTGKYKPSADEMKHIDEVLKMMSVLTNDNRFDKTYNDIKLNGGNIKGGKNMCAVLDKMINDGIEKGIKKGKKEGIKEGMKEGREQGIHDNSVEVAQRMLKKQFDIDVIAEMTGLSKEYICSLQ